MYKLEKDQRVARERFLIEEIAQAEAPKFEVVQSSHADVIVDIFVEVLREMFLSHPTLTYVPREGSMGPDLERTSIVIVDKYTEDALFLPVITLSLNNLNTTWLTFSQSPFNTVLKPQYDSYGRILRDNRGRMVPSHYEYNGAFESSISFNINANSTIEREEIANYLHTMQAEVLRDTLYMRGVFIKGLSTGGFSEVDYRNTKIYQSTLSVDIYSEWRRKIPVGDTLKSIGMLMNLEEGVEESTPIAYTGDPLTIYNLENEYYVEDDLTGDFVIPEFLLSPSNIEAPIALVFSPTTLRWEVSDYWQKVLEETEIDFADFEEQLTRLSAKPAYLEHARKSLIQAQALRALSATQGRELADGAIALRGAIVYQDGSVALKGGTFNEPLLESTFVNSEDEVIIHQDAKQKNKLVFVAKNLVIDSEENLVSGNLYKRVVDRLGNEQEVLLTDQSKNYLDGENYQAMTALDFLMILIFCKQPFRYSVAKILEKLDRLLLDLADTNETIIYRNQKIANANFLKQKLIERSEEFLLRKPTSL